MADYLRAVLDAREKKEESLRGFLRDRGLNQFAFGRWRAFLGQEYKAWSPVYGPLAILAGIPEKEFAEKSVIAIGSLGKDPKRPVNPLMLKALQDARPKTFKAACEVIADVIAAPHPAGKLTKDQADVFKVLGQGRAD